MTRFIFPFFLLSAALAPPLAAFAQTADNAQVMERMDRLEHDLMLLQRQVAQGGPPLPGTAGTIAVPPGDAASLEVRLSAIEEELRNLRGKVEENENQVHKLSEALDKFQHDTEFRFGELAKAAPPAVAAPPKPEEKPVAPNGQTTAGDGTLRPPEGDNADQGKTDFATPREHYNYAFRLLNQTQYVQAAAAFDAFIKKYPKDPLVGNAYYWEGDTYYVRRDYVNAADDFRQGFEAAPEGPKAADNLFKLALSLDALNRDKEACVVLQQVMAKFKKSAGTIAQKADQEQKRIGCK